MSQKSFLDNKKSRKNFPYVSSFLFLKASLSFYNFSEYLLIFSTRSQWKKLEIALKFIHKSKQSAYQSNQKVDIKTAIVASSNMKRPSKPDINEEPAAKKQKLAKFCMKIDPICLSNESINDIVSISSSARTNWEKLKSYVLKHIL